MGEAWYISENLYWPIRPSHVLDAGEPGSVGQYGPCSGVAVCHSGPIYLLNHRSQKERHWHIPVYLINALKVRFRL